MRIIYAYVVIRVCTFDWFLCVFCVFLYVSFVFRVVAEGENDARDMTRSDGELGSGSEGESLLGHIREHRHTSGS